MHGIRNIQSQGIKVLLVDDEEEYVYVLSNRLGKRNVDVTKAYNGSEAIQVLCKQDFHVAVVDLKMENIDGIELLNLAACGGAFSTGLTGFT